MKLRDDQLIIGKEQYRLDLIDMLRKGREEGISIGRTQILQEMTEQSIKRTREELGDFNGKNEKNQGGK